MGVGWPCFWHQARSAARPAPELSNWAWRVRPPRRRQASKLALAMSSPRQQGRGVWRIMGGGLVMGVVLGGLAVLEASAAVARACLRIAAR